MSAGEKHQRAKEIVGDLLKWEVVIDDGVTVPDAITGGAEILLSEDLSHGQTIQGVTIMNPFKANPSQAYSADLVQKDNFLVMDSSSPARRHASQPKRSYMRSFVYNLSFYWGTYGQSRREEDLRIRICCQGY